MTREEVCAYIRQNFNELQVAVYDAMAKEMARLTPEEVCEKFLSGREGTEFDLFSIDALAEGHEEIMDLFCYIALHQLQLGEQA